MKKYAIIIGENNKELGHQVQEALFAVGFEWCFAKKEMAYCAPIMKIDNGIMENITDPESTSSRTEGAEWLLPSYVIAHAAELDGAKGVHEIAEDGYKIISIQDRKENPYPAGARVRWCWTDGGSGWATSCNDSRWSDADPQLVAFAVPLDFTFEPVPNPRIEELRDLLHRYADELATLQKELGE